ncbi:MAG: ribosomal protein S18-alanine N-acetyltransferase [Burkholderiales bacterium]|jgi:ribosomal-protein-alanine N-acetyltransferase|nr:ribosomal protein S18-alanine N-acetyltransferase [Burkholderiales bacterium]
MSAQLDDMPRFRRMVAQDLTAVEAIERSVYTHPWTIGNFTDSLEAGYHCWILEREGRVAGYSVVMIAAGEAHLLNLSIALPLQRRGLGSELLRFVVKLARDYAAQTIYLEVRESNAAGRALYAQHGFAEIGQRRGYYPAGAAREDAVTMEKKLE